MHTPFVVSAPNLFIFLWKRWKYTSPIAKVRVMADEIIRKMCKAEQSTQHTNENTERKNQFPFWVMIDTGGKIPLDFNIAKQQQATHIHNIQMAVACNQMHLPCIHDIYSGKMLLRKNQFINFEMPEFNNNFSCIFIISPKKRWRTESTVALEKVTRTTTTGHKKPREKKWCRKHWLECVSARVTWSSYYWHRHDQSSHCHRDFRARGISFYGEGQKVCLLAIIKWWSSHVCTKRGHFHPCACVCVLECIWQQSTSSPPPKCSRKTAKSSLALALARLS